MSSEFMFASPGDGDGILEIMEHDAAKGSIRLAYTRRPDPVDSFLKESPDAAIGVYKNEDRIVATICGIPRKVYIGGKEVKACYMTNMKRSPGCRGNINWIRAFGDIYDKTLPDVCFCSIVKENEFTIRMLTKKRKNLPYVEESEGYRTFMISPSARIKDPAPGLKFRQAEPEDEDAILEFLKAEGSRRNFFPVVDSLHGDDIPDVTDFYLLEKDGEILCAGALWDRTEVKQYIVMECTGIMAFFRMLNPVLPLLGYVKIPKNGEKADLAFLSFFLAKDDEENYYRSFLSRIRKEAAKSHDMFVLGAGDHNPKRKILDKIRAVTFDTRICEVVMSDFKDVRKLEFDHSDIEAECSLL